MLPCHQGVKHNPRIRSRRRLHHRRLYGSRIRRPRSAQLRMHKTVIRPICASVLELCAKVRLRRMFEVIPQLFQELVRHFVSRLTSVGQRRRCANQAFHEIRLVVGELARHFYFLGFHEGLDVFDT
jgi:hypothetical protein